ncbi:hypothetical protein SAMN04487914_10186 [Arthrobacter sp. ok909]|nr:hypothetical protein SAMN04487914_10186 [Arthrobacter sp. ok909]
MDGARDSADQAPKLTPGLTQEPGPGGAPRPLTPRPLAPPGTRAAGGNRGMMKEDDAGGLPGTRDAAQVVNKVIPASDEE